jgi:TetR/AcrR family transcriptional regulator, repressor of the ameABC operon
MARRPWHPSTDTRAEILDEAERQLQSVGFEALTMGSIAKALGMSPANVFKNFGNKSGLVDAVVLRLLMDIDRSLDTTETIRPAPERLRVLIRQIVESQLSQGKRNAKIAVIIGTYLVLPPSAIAFYNRLIDRFKRLLDDGIAEGEFAATDTSLAAEVVGDCFIGIIDPANLWRMSTVFSPEEVTKKCDQLVEFVLKGLRVGLDK